MLDDDEELPAYIPRPEFPEIRECVIYDDDPHIDNALASPEKEMFSTILQRVIRALE